MCWGLILPLIHYGTGLLPNKYFKEPTRAKAKKFGAQQVMFWELLQNFRRP